MQNAAYAICPYRYQHMWVFDGERVGLLKMLFLICISDILDRAVGHLQKPESDFKVLFNDTSLPQPDLVLKSFMKMQATTGTSVAKLACKANSVATH
jgi:hypothetical protein